MINLVIHPSVVKNFQDASEQIVYSSAIEEFEANTLFPILNVVFPLCILVGILILLFYFIRLLTISGYKNKYDFINANEINYLWKAALLFVISLSIYVDTLPAFVAESILWFVLKFFVIAALGSIIGVIFYYSLKFYYPFFIQKRLTKLRHKPRTNPANGNKMKLLSEEEEDVYLDEGMQAEEDVFSVDYDVWIDEKTGYTLIEKYQGHLTAFTCPDCNYQTLKIFKEEVITSPELDKEGEIERYYKCSYCSYKTRKSVKVARLKAKEEEVVA